MRKIIFLIFLCLFLAVNADTENVNFKILEQLSDKYKFKRLVLGELHNAKRMNAFQLMHHLNVKKYKLPFILRKGKKLLKQNLIM